MNIYKVIAASLKLLTSSRFDVAKQVMKCFKKISRQKWKEAYNTNNKSHKIENKKIKQSKEFKTTKTSNQKNTNGSNERNQQQ